MHYMYGSFWNFNNCGSLLGAVHKLCRLESAILTPPLLLVVFLLSKIDNFDPPPPLRRHSLWTAPYDLAGQLTLLNQVGQIMPLTLSTPLCLSMSQWGADFMHLGSIYFFEPKCIQ